MIIETKKNEILPLFYFLGQNSVTVYKQKSVTRFFEKKKTT
jgi:hypothetical protein